LKIFAITANDISSYIHNGKELFDIQTGSLVTAPSPYRMITMKDSTLDVSTRTVQSIVANLPGGLSFPAYSDLFLSQHLDGYFNYYLTNQLGAPAPLATFASPLFRNGIMAHFAGDENALNNANKLTISVMSEQLAGIVTTLWTDPGVKDNKTPIHNKLKTLYTAGLIIVIDWVCCFFVFCNPNILHGLPG
jgi:hypothetical protein